MTFPSSTLSAAALFLEVAHQAGALRFGRFELKSGRISPYFFNAGAFNTGEHMLKVATAYAQGIQERGLTDTCNLLFGPAYKGIPLVTGVAMGLAQAGVSLPFAFNRKAEKDHGEGGRIVGAPLQGARVLLLDDVMTAGTALGEAVQTVQKEGGLVTAMLIGLDRQERSPSSGHSSAVEDMSQRYRVPIHALATLEDILRYTQDHPALAAHRSAMEDYRCAYGVPTPH